MNRFNLTYYQATLNATLSGTLWSFTFTGKEKDAETGYGYFGARYMDHDLMTMWMSVDPMADKYPGMSPYSYCVNNPVKLVDPDGEEISPIYDKWGNLLGTDDQGLKGKAIVMDGENFSQGMSHENALRHNLGKNGFQDEIAYEKFSRHYAGLKDRPDYDGFVTITEGIRWAKKHPNAKDNPTPDNILYINAALLDLGFLTVYNSGLRLDGDYTNVNLYDYVNPKSPRSVSTTYALGNTAIMLLDNNGTIAFKGDVYDWDYHDGSPMRNALIFLERFRTGINDNHGFKVSIYGTAKINQKWPF